MVKKQKDETPNVNSTPNRDIIQRLNFLYQASVYLQSLEPPNSIVSESPPSLYRSKGKNKEIQVADTSKDFDVKKKHTSKRHTRRKRTTGDLARSYVQCMRAVGQKTTVKIDPALKRSLCSSCGTTLIPGSSASVRVKKSSSHGHLVIYTCLHCKSSKGIPAPPTLPLNRPINVIEELEGNFSPSTAVIGTSDKSGSFSMAAPSSQSPVQNGEKEKKKKPVHSSRSPRLLPFFARPDAGHVIFKGSEVVALDQRGLGVCFV